MIRSVVKHNYIGGKNGKARAKAHINYVAFRPGPDRIDGSREFYNKDRENIRPSEIKELIDRQTDPNVTMHKIILSPGMNNIDLKDYAREVMETFGRSKGLDLDWTAADHKNTDHWHTHIELMGVDKNGRQVRFKGKEDYALLREIGDRYLDRTRPYERILERDFKDLLLREDYKRDGDEAYRSLFGKYGPQKELLDKSDYLRKGSDDYRTLFGEIEKPEPWSREKAIEYLKDDEKVEINGQTYTKFSSSDELTAADRYLKGHKNERIDRDDYATMWTWIGTKNRNGDDFYEKQAKRDWDADREFKQFEEEFRKGSESGEIGHRHPMGRQRHIEAAGRLGSEHSAYGLGDTRQYIKDIIKDHPERKEEFQGSLDYFDALERQMKDDRKINEPLDTILLLDLGEETREQKSERQAGERAQMQEAGIPVPDPKPAHDPVWEIVLGFDQTKKAGEREDDREDRGDEAP